MPGNILNNGMVPREYCHCVETTAVKGRPRDVPEADGLIIGSREEMSIVGCIPGEAVALLLVTFEANIRLTATLRGCSYRVIRVIKYQHITTWCFRGDYVGILWHVSGTVNLALVVNFHGDFKLARWKVEATEISSLAFVCACIEFSGIVW